MGRITQLLNQLQKNNVMEKAEQLEKLVTRGILAWFSQFFILNRVQKEVNNHPMYAELLNRFRGKETISYITNESCRMVKNVLLNESLLFQQKGEQAGQAIIQFLRNLSSFIGNVTLALNRPLLSRDLDLKQLLFEGFKKGKLHYSIPVSCRVLKEGTKSQIFVAGNPYIHGILCFLGELKNHVHALSLN